MTCSSENKGVSIRVRLLNRELAMENGFLDKMEDNVVLRVWSEKMQLEKGDSLTEGYTSELWDFTRISMTLNNLQELKEIWAQWDHEVKQLFYDLVPTVEEYTTLLCCPMIQADKAYFRAVNIPTFVKKLMNIMGMSEQWLTARIKQKGESKYETVSDLFDRLDRRVTPVSMILAETFRSLNTYWRTGEGRFICCAQLLLAWFHSHFWKVEKVSYRVFSENYSLLKEFTTTPRLDDITEERWIVILQNLQEEDVEWRSHWMVPDEILYRCGDYDWVSLLRIWGAIWICLFVRIKTI
ncbi:hypothetical protein Goshw_027973 [Gossypium schwendimanii]|uniref:DUF7745 domain-containing protein n=1 Tax=Gossypium schwendimanii TaxID=34291 RepID=A0A7J9NF40_GOSSC|nr:hypothetical protein [Gossypium schwendimanii]